MLRIMLADLYRAAKGKVFWLTALFMAIFAALTVFVFGMAPGILEIDQIETIITYDGQTVDVLAAPDFANFEITAAESVAISADGMWMLAYVILAIAAVIALTPFDVGAIKNELSLGASRSKLYLARWLLSALITFVFMVFHTFIYFVFGLMGGGMGEWSSEFMSNFVWGFAAQTIFVLGYLSVAMLFIFAARKESISIYSYAAFATIPPVVGSLLSMAWPDIVNTFAVFELSLLTQTFADHSEMYTYQIVRGLLVGVAYILVPTALGLILFKRADLK